MADRHFAVDDKLSSWCFGWDAVRAGFIARNAGSDFCPKDGCVAFKSCEQLLIKGEMDPFFFRWHVGGEGGQLGDGDCVGVVQGDEIVNAQSFIGDAQPGLVIWALVDGGCPVVGLVIEAIERSPAVGACVAVRLGEWNSNLAELSGVRDGLDGVRMMALDGL